MITSFDRRPLDDKRVERELYRTLLDGSQTLSERERYLLAEAIRHALDNFGEVTLGATDGLMAADALERPWGIEER